MPNLYAYVENVTIAYDPLGLNKTSWTLYDSDGNVMDSGNMKPDPKAKSIPGRTGDSEQKILRQIDADHNGNLAGSKLIIDSEPTFIRTKNGKVVPIQGIAPCDFCDTRMDEFAVKNKMEIEYNYRGKTAKYPKCS